MRLLLLTIAVLLVATPVLARDYIENFENYSPGTFSQPGWYGNGPWSIVAGSALNGTKVITPNGAYDMNCPYSGVTFRDGTVATINVRMSTAAGSFFSWNVMNDEGPFVGLCWYTDGLFRYSMGAYGWDTSLPYTMYRGDRYLLSATMNFTTQKVAYSVNDLTNSARSFSFIAPFGLPTSTLTPMNGGIYLSGVGSEFDNLAVSTVPEPSALVALGTGLTGICGVVIRRIR